MSQPAQQMNSVPHPPASLAFSPCPPRLAALRPRALLLAAALGLAACSARGNTNIWTGGGADLNWSKGLNWTNGVAPQRTDDVYFSTYGDAGATGAAGNSNNVVDVTTTIESLWYTNNPVGGTHTTFLNPGVTLTVTGALANALFVGTVTDVAGSPSVNATINGPGAALFLTNATGTLSVRQQSTTSGASATLDLRGLDTLTAFVSQVLAGGENVGKDQGNLYLAKTNFITCFASGTTPGLVVGNNNTSGSKTSRAWLGVTNVILADGGMEVPTKRMTGNLSFNAPGSAAYFRNRAGTGAQDHWYIGYNNTTSTGTGCNGTVDFSAGTVDALVNTLIVGASENNVFSGAGSGNGTLNFYGGSIVATAMDIGEQMASTDATTGTVNMNDNNGPAQLTVNGNLRLARYQGSGAPSGTLSVNGNGGASVTVNGNIISGSAGGSTVHFANSALTLTGTMGAAGSSQGPVNNFQFYSSALTLNLGSSPNPLTAVCTVNTLDLQNTSGGCTLTILGSALAAGQFHLFTYQTLANLGAEAFATVNLPAQIQGYVSNNVAASSIDLVITNLISPVWNGLPNGNWDINVTPNWMTPGGAPLTYHQATVPGDLVTFDDRANGTTTVNLTTTLSPTSISVNNSAKNYTYTGSGQLSGPGGLSKHGSAMLTLANSGPNNFTGPVTLGGGTLQLGVAQALPTNAPVTLADAADAVLDLHNLNQTLRALDGGGPTGGNLSLGSGTLTIAGAGGSYAGVISGSGGLMVTSAGSQALSGANLYAGGTLISTGVLALANSSGNGTGTGSVDIEGGTLNIGNGTSGGSVAGTITNNGYVTLNRSDDMTLANLMVGSGALVKYLTDTVTISSSNSYAGGSTIADGTLSISDPHALGTGLITVSFGSNPQLDVQGGITLTNPILVNSKGGALNGNNPVVVNVSGTNVLSGPLQATSSGTDVPFRSDADELILSGSFLYLSASSHQNVRLRGNAMGEWHGSIANTTNGALVALYKDDSGTWVLTGSSTNTYTDVTQISGGTLLVNGAILGSSQVNVVNGGTVLGGAGLINTPVSFSGGTLSPGSSLDVPSIGTLTISKTLTLDPGSTALFELSKVGGLLANDQVTGLSSVTYDGYLQLSFTGTLNGGEVFKLFNAAAYNGAFGSITLPSNPLPPPLSWDTSFLTVDGTVRVDGGITLTNAVRTSDGNFQLGGSVVPAASGLPYRVLATTNISVPLSTWGQVGSGTFAGGPFTFTDLDATNHPARFYIVVTP